MKILKRALSISLVGLLLAATWPASAVLAIEAEGPGAAAPGGRVSVFDRHGTLLARWGGGQNPCAPGDFFAPHGICVDSRGDVYVAEVVWSAGGKRGLVPADVAELVPPVIAEALRHGLPILEHRWHGRFLPQAFLVGPEARGSSPVRMVRDDTTRAAPGIDGLYPVGEGAGYAGGIISAAVDGLRTARAIVARYAVPSG